MKVGFSVLNYLNHEDTKDCVLSLLGALEAAPGGEECQVVLHVVDNHSPNGSFETLRAFVSQLVPPAQVTVEAKQTAANLGFAGGHNVALRELFEVHRCDVAFLVNSDLVVHRIDLEDLRRRVDAQEHAIFGVYLHSSDGCAVPGGDFFSRNTFVSASAAREMRGGALPYVSGAFLGIGRTLFERVGCLNEENFLYFEELDYFYKVRGTLGRFPDTVFLPGWVVDHKLGGSTGNSTTRKSLLAEYYSARARIRFARTCLPRFTLNALCYNAALSLHRALKLQFANSLTILSATVNALKGEGGIKSQYHVGRR